MHTYAFSKKRGGGCGGGLFACLFVFDQYMSLYFFLWGKNSILLVRSKTLKILLALRSVYVVHQTGRYSEDLQQFLKPK